MRGRPKFLAAIGLAIRVFTIVAFATAILIPAYYLIDWPSGVLQASFIAFLIGISLGPISLVYMGIVRPLLNFGSRFQAIGGQEALAADPRPPVLYLRSFAAERKVAAAELALGRMLNHIGPLLAIGRPEEIIPRLGAARLYVPEQEWRQTVSLLLERSCLVVLVAGGTPGLTWEIQECRRLVSPKKLIVFVSNDKEQLKKFSDSIATIINGSIEHCFVEPIRYLWRWDLKSFLVDSGLISWSEFNTGVSGINGLISFDDQWKAAFHPVQITAEEFRTDRDQEYGGPLVSDWTQRMARALTRAVQQNPADGYSASSTGPPEARIQIMPPPPPIDFSLAIGALRIASLFRFIFRLVLVFFLIALLLSALSG